ncbi:MAG: hypothetical protein H6607_02625 [Flavobacteriales bacterium]|nr:hypothetical protein [Flavobacteriales bacterium]
MGIFKKFFPGLIMVTALSIAIIITIHTFMNKPIDVWNWLSLAFFFLLTLGISTFHNRMTTSNNKTFMSLLYGSMGLRFIFSIFFIVIYLIYNEITDKLVVVIFLILYLLFTSFELFHLVTKLRAEKQRDINVSTL